MHIEYNVRQRWFYGIQRHLQYYFRYIVAVGQREIYIYIGIYVNLTSSLDGKKKMKLMKWHIRYDRIDGIMICQWLMATELYVRYIEDATKFTVEQELLTL